MKIDTVNYLVVGTFVLAIGIAFLILMYSITGRSGPTDTYYSNYSNVSGLKFGTGVFFEGFRVGQIESIEPVGSGAGLEYQVEMSVTRGWEIPIDSKASIVAGGLISAMTIEISAGSDERVLEPGATIEGVEQVNMFAALSEAATVLSELANQGIRPLLDNINQSVTALSDEYIALRRENLAPFVTSMQTNVESVLTRADDSVARLQAILNDENQRKLSNIITNVDDAAEGLSDLVARIDETRVELHAAVSEINAMIGENRPGIDSAVANLEASLEDLSFVMETLSERIDSIVFNLDLAVRNTREFSRTIRENPGSLLRGAPQPERGTGP